MMSSNDFVQIVENNEGKFEVSTCDMESDWHELIDIASELKKAILIAKKYMKERIKEGFPVEYGLEIYFKEERNK
jgi:hypothetical protein